MASLIYYITDGKGYYLCGYRLTKSGTKICFVPEWTKEKTVALTWNSLLSFTLRCVIRMMGKYEVTDGSRGFIHYDVVK